MPDLSNGDLLESIIRRSMMPAGPGDIPAGIGDPNEPVQPGVTPGSWLDRQTRKKKQMPWDAPPAPAPQGFGVQGSWDAGAPPAAPEWGAGAGMLAPGIGGLGNMNPAVTTAPTNPLDPNYAPPASTASQLQDLVRPSTSTPDRVPLPTPRPDVPDVATPAEAGLPRERPAEAPQREADGQPAAIPREVNGQPTVMGGATNQAGMLPSIGDIGSRIMQGLGAHSNLLLALGAGFAGAPNIGQGISRAAAAAIPAGQADIQQQLMMGNQGAAYNALIAAGVPPNLARIGATDKEVMKNLLGTYVNPKMEIKEVKTETPLGTQTRLYAVDPLGRRPTVDVQTGQQVGPGYAGGGVAGAPPGTPGSQVTGIGGAAVPPGTDIQRSAAGQALNDAMGGKLPADAMDKYWQAAQLPYNYDPETNRDETFLKTLDPITGKAVKDIADGKLPGTGRNLQKLMPLVSRYENGFDNVRYQARQGLEKYYYGGGKGGDQLRAANTAIDHGVKLEKAINDLHNFSTMPGFLNKATGKVSEQYNKQYQDALARFRFHKEVFSREMDMALTGKSTVSGQNEMRSRFGDYASPVTNRAALYQAMGDLQDRVNEHENSYRTGMGKKGQQFTDMLTQRGAMNTMLQNDAATGRPLSGGARAQAPAAAAPQARPPGVYNFDANGNPVQ